MLKKIIDSAAFAALDPALQALYKAGENGKYLLQLEDDDAEPLRRAKEHEVGLRQIAERDLRTAQEALTAAASEIETLRAAAPADVQKVRETLTAEYEGKITKLKDDNAKKVSALETTIKKIYVTDVAGKIASEIALDEGAAELLSDRIAQRLQVEMVDGNPVTRVVSADGQPSAMTPDELKAECLQNPKWAGILRASDASGGGASNGGRGNGVPKKLSELGDEARAKLQKENPAEWNRLLAEAEAAARQPRR